MINKNIIILCLYKMNLKHVLLFIVAVLVLGSCSTPKDLTYMQNLEDKKVNEISSLPAITIKPEDKLSIVVNSREPSLAAMFNLPVMSNRVGSDQLSYNTGNNNVSFYTVDTAGDIDFPVLGKLHIAGMSRGEVADYIKNRLVNEKYLNDAVVVVEYVNTGITVAGEVNNPGRILFNRDRLTLLDALGMAGDLTIQGKRTNVLVVREIDGNPTAFRVDLTDAESLMSSPVYYLQQNDYVYVEPNDMKKRSSTVNGNTALSASFWVSVASLLTSIAVLIFK